METAFHFRLLGPLAKKTYVHEELSAIRGAISEALCPWPEGSFRRRYLLTVQPSGTFVPEAALLADWYAKFAASFEQATV